MKANELIHGGLYLIHDTSDIVVRYDIISNSFKSEWYEYHLTLFHDDVCAADNDRCIFVKPISLTAEILEKNGFEYDGGEIWFIEWEDKDRKHCLNFRKMYDIVTDGWNALGIMISREVTLITSVHELQQALHLCGLNELAENLKVE